jgi:SulP family sulfate permease
MAAAAGAGLSPAYIFLEAVSGVTVALAMVPEAVAFSLAARIPPQIGIVTSFIICLLTTLLGGRPAMVSGATGSIAVLIGPLIQEHGLEYLFYAVMLMGVIQIVMGLIGVGNLVRLVPISVEIGFANGLAIIIGLSQFSSYKLAGQEAAESAGGWRPEAFKVFADGAPWEQSAAGAFAGIITALSFLVTVFLPYVAPRIPSALSGIALGTAFEWAVVRAAFNSHTTTVGELGSAGGSFPLPVWSEQKYQMPGLSGKVLGDVYGVALLMAVIGILESAMTLSLINERTKTKGNVMREVVGQGVANIVCGAFGGMGGCAMLGQSMINVSSGARGRLSTFCTSIFLLFVLLVAYPAIDILPVAALAGVMFNVVYETFEWGSLKLLLATSLPRSLRNRFLSEESCRHKKIRRADALVIVVVTVVTLLLDLAVAVGCGVIVAVLTHVCDAANMIDAVAHEEPDAEGRTRVKVYDVRGVLFFGSASKFLELFDAQGDPEEVRLVFESSYIADYSAVDALNKLGERYSELGKRLTLQLLHPGSSRIVHKAAGLLVKEITLSSAEERVLDSPRYRHHVEGFSQSLPIPENTPTGQMEEESEGPRLRRRATLPREASSGSVGGSATPRVDAV